MKIGIDGRAASWYRGTGIGTYTYQLIYNMCQLDKINSYKLFLSENATTFPVDDNVSTCQIEKGGSDNFWEEVGLPNLLTNTGIEAYWVPQNGIGLPTDKACPFIITLHDIIPYRLPETVGPQYLKIYTSSLPDILKRCDGIITVSEFSRQDIIKEFNFPQEKIFVTHLAAEDIYFPRNKEKCKDYLRSHYELDGDFILYVGGFSPRKNISGLIEAYSMVKPQIPHNTKLVILGKKGRSYYNYRDLAINLDVKEDVVFPGYIPIEELPIFYNAAKLFCYPSFYEGFGLPPLEAMACGTPVITSNTTSMPEILSDAVLYAKPEDTSALAKSIIEIFHDDNLYKELCFHGLMHSSRFSWKTTALSTIDIINKIIKQ
jgi:glycosyltransferase involved in cell wall biosynthesis